MYVSNIFLIWSVWTNACTVNLTVWPLKSQNSIIMFLCSEFCWGPISMYLTKQQKYIYCCIHFIKSITVYRYSLVAVLHYSWVIVHDRLLTFFTFFSKHFFISDTIIVSYSLDPDQERRSVCTDLGPNCQQTKNFVASKERINDASSPAHVRVMKNASALITLATA